MADHRDSETIREEIAHFVAEGNTSGIGWSLTVDEPEFSDDDSMAPHIARLINEGYWSGYHPNWSLECQELIEAESVQPRP